MNPTLELIRLEENEQFGTFGVLKIQKEVFCVTLEPPDRLNQTGRSNIPAQQYICKKIASPTHGNTYEVMNVPGRTSILFHAGNTVEHTEGCIILAQHYGKLRENRAVLNSGATFRAFLSAVATYSQLHLTIKEIY